ncbi:MAG: glutathione S-transferase family protein [Gammaproteobacteria bacterium]
MTAPAEYVVHGAPISLFTRKLEAALAFKGIAYRFEIKDEARGAALEARAGTHQVPVLETPDGWWVADSTPQIRWLDALHPLMPMFPPGPAGVLVHLLEDVLDEWVSRVMVHYRWHDDDNTRHIVSALSGREVDLGTARAHPLATWGLRACRATGTASVTAQQSAGREYLGLVEALETQLAQTPYALGELPTAVDCALLGGLRAHTLPDPHPDLSMYPRVNAWAAAGHAWPGRGSLPPFPATTRFGEHLLELAREHYGPFMAANRAARADGRKAFVVDTYGEPVSYLARAYPERARRMIGERIEHTLTAAEQREVRAWLGACGLAHCFDLA